MSQGDHLMQPPEFALDLDALEDRAKRAALSTGEGK